MEKTVASGNYNPIDTAPKNGKFVRLCLQDKFGTYGFEPAVWNKAHGWINAKTGSKLVPQVVGWRHIKERGGMDYAETKAKNYAS